MRRPQLVRLHPIHLISLSRNHLFLDGFATIQSTPVLPPPAGRKMRNPGFSPCFPPPAAGENKTD